jgi:ABC-2 type transport system permease protein
MSRFLKRPLRVLAVMGKELIEVLRRPKAMVSVIAGPMLILALFGLGYVGQPALRTELVLPTTLGLSEDQATYAKATGDRVAIVAMGTDPTSARERLRRHETDLLVVAPPDAAPTGSRPASRSRPQCRVRRRHPYRAFIARAAPTSSSRPSTAGSSGGRATGARRGVIRRATVPPAARPEVVAAPTRAEVVDLAASPPNIVSFYGIMVLALIVQHTTVTVSALSMLRDRRRGAIDLYRISPIGAGELLLGKYLAFALLGTAVACGPPSSCSPSACRSSPRRARAGLPRPAGHRLDRHRRAHRGSESDRQAQLALLVLGLGLRGLAIDWISSRRGSGRVPSCCP